MSSEWAGVALISYMLAARYGINFKSKCPDPELYEADADGGVGRLVRMPPRVYHLITQVGVEGIVAGSEFTATDVGKALSAADRVNWDVTPGYVHYNLESDRFYPMSNAKWPYVLQEADAEPRTDTPGCVHVPKPVGKESGPLKVLSDPYASSSRHPLGGVQAAEADIVVPDHAAPTTVLDPYRPESHNERYPPDPRSHPKATRVPQYSTAGPAGLRAGQPPASPPTLRRFGRTEPVSETPEEKALLSLQRACQRLGKNVSETVVDALERATAWAGDSARLAHIGDRAEEMTVLLGRLHATNEESKSLIWRNVGPSGTEPPAKRRRT